MATKLKNLKIRKVDFVDEGANPDAHIKMLKRREGAGEDGGGVLKKLFSFFGRAAGMEQEEIDSAVEEIQKGDSVSFHEKVLEANNQKIADEIWDVCYALQYSLCSILNDGELDSTGAAPAMQESLDEFYTVVQESIKEWSSGKSASIVRKSEEVSEAELEIMKSAVERLNETIEKACKDTQKEKSEEDGAKSNKNQKGDGDKMKIDKSKLTEAERAFLESIEKRCSVEEGKEQAKGGAVSANAAGEEATAAANVAAAVTKAGTQAISGKETAAEAVEGQGIPATVSAEQPEDIYKGLHPSVRAELEELKKFRAEAEDRELAEIAKRYALIGKKEEELVPLLKSLKAAGGTAYEDMLAMLDHAVEAVERSGVFAEIGKSGHGEAVGTAWAEAETKAAELMKSRTGLSKVQALEEVFLADPVLAEKCEKEG